MPLHISRYTIPKGLFTILQEYRGWKDWKRMFRWYSFKSILFSLLYLHFSRVIRCIHDAEVDTTFMYLYRGGEGEGRAYGVRKWFVHLECHQVIIYSFILACNLWGFIVICSHLMMQRKENTTWKASKPPANPLLKSTFPDHFHLFAFTKEIDQRFHRIKTYRLVYVNDCLSLVFWTTSMPMAASTTMLWRWCWTDWNLLRLILQHGLICKQDYRHGF